jgi:hypothetical protein
MGGCGQGTQGGAAGFTRRAVLVHCEHGGDRTGLIMALNRILYEGWWKEAAIAVMMNGGFGFQAVRGNIPALIRRVDVEREVDR